MECILSDFAWILPREFMILLANRHSPQFTIERDPIFQLDTATQSQHSSAYNRWNPIRRLGTAQHSRE
jgi:hypothetical protein